MAQSGIDKLLSLTDSRYRLSMIAARRAAQLKMGIPPVLVGDDYPKTRNTVTVALKELEVSDAIHWGQELPTVEELRQLVERERREHAETYTVSREMESDDDEEGEEDEIA